MMSGAPRTIAGLLAHGADDATALSAPGGARLSYFALRALVAQVGQSLFARGIGAGDRVAIVLDNGPEMAAAFLAIAAAAAAAPLNPGYRADEFEFYLTDLRAKLLVVAGGKDSPAIAVARKLRIPIAHLAAQPARGAGSFTLEFAHPAEAPAATSPSPRAPQEATSPAGATGREPTPDDIALVLHTSGTTSRPKIVPLAHRNVCASARNVSESLALTVSDRGLVIMPL